MSTSADRSSDAAPKLPTAKPCAELRRLVNHRDICAAFGISTNVLMRAVRKGEFIRPHSLIGNSYLFDRAAIEHKLETGLWPRDAKFHGVRHLASSDDADS